MDFELDKAIYDIRRKHLDLDYSKRGDSLCMEYEIKVVIYVTYEFSGKLKGEALLTHGPDGVREYNGYPIYIVANCKNHPDFEVYVR